jgi:hypothetical protein
VPDLPVGSTIAQAHRALCTLPDHPTPQCVRLHTDRHGELPQDAPEFVYLWRKTHMLETVAIILLILWALGLVSSVSLGGFIHVLLVIAVVVILVRVIQGRKI